MKISILTPSIRSEGLKVVQESLEKQTFQDFEWLVEMGIVSHGCDLSKAWNRMLKRAKGEWIVLLEDYIKIPPDGLERFLKVADPKKLFTGAVGKTLDWKSIKWDWRNFGESREVDFRHWEIDWAFGPLQAFKDVGGFEEEYDEFWSSENVEIAYRMSRLGYKFLVLPDNKGIQWAHDEIIKHPFRHKFSPHFHNARLKDIEMGLKPVKLNYLD
jgi:glycosyltransferase involved in cell wall biosynthesis